MVFPTCRGGEKEIKGKIKGRKRENYIIKKDRTEKKEMDSHNNAHTLVLLKLIVSMNNFSSA